MGDQPSACWSASAPTRCRWTWCGRRAGSPPASTRAGWRRRSTGRAATPPAAARPTRRCGWRRASGAETTRLVGHDLPAEILGYAERENITQVVVGRSKAGFLGRLAGRSLSDALARRASLVGVHVVTGDKPRGAPRGRSPAVVFDRALPVGALAAAGSVAVAVGVGEALDRWLRLPNLSMIFLIAVLLSAARFGVRAAIVAAVLSFLAYDFFFVPPYYQFTIAEPQEFFALVIFLAVASLVGWLAGRARDQERLARASAQATSSLFEFSRKLSGAATLDDILDTTTVYAHKTLRARGVVMLLPEDGELPLSAAWPPIDELDAGENGAARWAFDKSEPAGWKTDTLPNVRFQFRPLVTSRGVVGVCGFEPADRDAPISPTLEHGLNLILEQAAIAIDRALLVKDSVRTVALEENEKLRGTLLASLSHDLRTPLATITGAVTTLRKFGDGMAAEQRADLLASIEEESARLTRFIANLLDMSRIEAGALKPKQDLVDVAEVVRAAIERARKAFPGQPVVDQPGARPALRALRRQSARAGAVQPARQCPEIRRRRAGDRPRAAGGRQRAGLGDRRRPGHQAGRSRAGVREILSRRQGRRAARRHRPRPVDQPRPGRSDGRQDLGREPGGQAARRAHRHFDAGGRSARDRQGGVMNGARVLIVDDEPQIVRFLKPALEASGYQVLQAASGHEALRLIANSAPDLIVLDLGLPDMDGKDVIARARSFAAAPIVVLSARDREAEKIAALDLGADDYVEKPFAIGELLARMRAALRHARAGATPKTRVAVDGLTIDMEKRLVDPRRRRDQADAARIRSVVRARRQSRPSDDPRPDPHRRLGPGAQGRHAIPARLRRPAARQDRARSRPADDHPHRVGRRLSVRGERVRRMPSRFTLPDRAARGDAG